MLYYANLLQYKFKNKFFFSKLIGDILRLNIIFEITSPNKCIFVGLIYFNYSKNGKYYF